ncbi:MAG: thioredoxin family protein [Chloroflexi bacterium]|nr:thioredoxin family protein [Chloroflexota bacterium]
MDGLEVEFPTQLKVVRVDVQSAFGRELAREYGTFTPTFVLFDAQGEELWRVVGSLDAEKVRQSIP